MSRAVTEQILTQSRRLVGVQRFKMAKIDPVLPFSPHSLIAKSTTKRAFRLYISTFVCFEIGSVYTITAGLP